MLEILFLRLTTALAYRCWDLGIAAKRPAVAGRQRPDRRLAAELAISDRPIATLAFSHNPAVT